MKKSLSSLPDSQTHRRDIALLRNDLKEKDLLIHSKTEQLTRVTKDLLAKSNEATILRRSVENLREQVSGPACSTGRDRQPNLRVFIQVSTLSQNCDDTRKEMREVSNRLEEKESESRAFQVSLRLSF